MLRQTLALAGPLVLFVAALIAGPPPLIITDSGHYLATVDDNGRPSLVAIDQIVDLRTGNKPVAPDTPAPEPPEVQPPPTGIAADVAEWSTEVGDPIAAQKYAIVFEVVRDGILDGKVATGDLFKALRISADTIVENRWDNFRIQLADHFSEQLQAGQLTTQTQIANQLELIRYGLQYSATGSKRLTDGEGLAVISKVNSILDQLGTQ